MSIAWGKATDVSAREISLHYFSHDINTLLPADREKYGNKVKQACREIQYEHEHSIRAVLFNFHFDNVVLMQISLAWNFHANLFKTSIVLVAHALFPERMLF